MNPGAGASTLQPPLSALSGLAARRVEFHGVCSQFINGMHMDVVLRSVLQ